MGSAGPANFAVPTDDAGVEKFVARLTTEEKAALCVGRDYWQTHAVERVGLPSIWVADGPHGLRKQKQSDHVSLTDNVPATCFPTAAALAATWDQDLLRAVGRAIGTEARAHGVSVVLGPGANIKRSPLCGRNFEYFSEDPYLTGALAAAFIDGVQSVGVGTSLKHFAVNNQEFRRFSIDAIVDERALREIYLAGFEAAVKQSAPWTMMAAYNLVNGTHCTENEWLLTDILRDEWGFDGVVVSDWGAVTDGAAAVAAGMELDMPGRGPQQARAIVDAVRTGELSAADLDRAAGRVVKLVGKALAAQKAGADRTAATETAAHPSYDADAHHELARRAAAAGAVLLKNDGDLLPFDFLHGDDDRTVAVIGAFAKHPRYQGAGSSVITPTRLDTAYDAFVERIGLERLTYAPGYDLRPDRVDVVDERLIAEARHVAQRADVAVVFAGLPALYETEGLDRSDLHMPAGHDALIEAVAAVNANVVVVLSNGAPVAMPWHEHVPAILEAYLGGQAGGSAVVQLLAGDVNPAGKLAETFPAALSDHPAGALFPGGPRTVEYRESIYVGYRYYDTAGKDVLFPFGHGLSYTTFAYDDLHVNVGDPKTGTAGEQFPPVTVSLTVTNTGPRSGSEVVQLYVRDVEAPVFRPEKELKRFAKISLAAGETQRVQFVLDRRAFAYWDVGRDDWHVADGQFEIIVGASSRDVRLRDVVTVGNAVPQIAPPRPDGAKAPPPTRDVYDDPRGHAAFSRDAFAALYGRPLPSNDADARGAFTLSTPFADMRSSGVARFFLWVAPLAAKATLQDEPDSPTTRRFDEILAHMSLRTLVLGGADWLNEGMLNGLLQMFNGRFFGGLWTFVRGFVRK